MAAVAAAAAAGGRQRIAHMKETAMNHLETIINLALNYIRAGDIGNPRVYGKICMKLGSAIDSAIAVNVLPSASHLTKLLLIVKEVYRRKTGLLQPSLMLLMLPIKAACQIGWFLDGDKRGLLMIAKEVSYGFSDIDKMSIEPSNAHSVLSNIVSRFYPTMKVEHMLTSFDVKAGYGTFVADFYISLGSTPRNCRNLRLLVAQLDNMDTAACISGPLNVDFLINGNVVPNRNKNDMGKGPQLPSDITRMVKYGLNLLQVFGDFDGKYIIALAFMNTVSPDPSQLQDYVRPLSSGVDSEMPSRISLYCPMSQHRIKTPVKGHICKHPQCFDYNYFIEANSTEPTWKCPLCNNPVSYRDLRIDRNFLKILNEVPNDVKDVIVSEDGSWMVAEANRDTMSHATVTTPSASLGQTQVNIGTTKDAEVTTVFTQTTGSLGQTRVSICATNQAPSTTMLTPPASVTTPAISFVQTKLNDCSTTMQAQSTTMFTPPAASPGQAHVNICTTSQAQTTTMFTSPAAVTKPAVSPSQTQVNVSATTQAKSTTRLTPPAASPPPQSVALAFNELRSGSKQGNYTTPTAGESQPAPNVSLASPTQPPEASRDAMPSGRMRGSLTGDRLQAARLQYLAPRQQPALANKPWSRPPISNLPTAFLKPQAPSSSDNV